MKYLVPINSRYFKVIRKDDGRLRVIYKELSFYKKDCVYDETELIAWSSPLGKNIKSEISNIREVENIGDSFIPKHWYLFILPPNHKNVDAVIVPKYMVERIEE